MDEKSGRFSSEITTDTFYDFHDVSTLNVLIFPSGKKTTIFTHVLNLNLAHTNYSTT